MKKIIAIIFVISLLFTNAFASDLLMNTGLSVKKDQTSVCSILLNGDGTIKAIDFALINHKVENGNVTSNVDNGDALIKNLEVFETYCIGKTVDEILEIKTNEVNGKFIADVRELSNLDIDFDILINSFKNAVGL